jgi:hypothetical protein
MSVLGTLKFGLVFLTVAKSRVPVPNTVMGLPLLLLLLSAVRCRFIAGTHDQYSSKSEICYSLIVMKVRVEL